MNARAWLRLSAKAIHDIASIGFGGAMAACLVINLTADRASAAQFATARHAYGAIAQYVLLPSMAVVVLSGLVALAATRAYMNSVWAWVKALLGIAVFEATLMLVGPDQREVVALVGNAAALDARLLAERNTLWLLLSLVVVNVVLAVWRPRLTWTVR